MPFLAQAGGFLKDRTEEVAQSRGRELKGGVRGVWES